MRTIVLASRSPRRQEILRAAGIPFSVATPAVPEVRRAGELPDAYVQRLARAKAEAVLLLPETVVLGADTVVFQDGQVIEKPTDPGHAIEILTRLSGRSHTVLTGIHLRAEERAITDFVATTVLFQAISADEIQEYVATGEPLDKAGAYGIQGGAGKFVQEIHGCYFNVVGLPVARVYRHWRALSGH